jgi:hypothetical protein
VIGKREQARILKRVREICLALPETSERLTHGSDRYCGVREAHTPSSRPQDRRSEDYAVWCAAPLGAQDTLVRSDPETFFVPPYVGYRGWVGMRLDQGPDWDQVKAIVEDAYAQVATTKRRARRT